MVTQPEAELCSLLVEELYGELPSRIFLTLLTRGRSSIPHLTQFTSMTPRQLRHGLAVLLQYNLLHFHVDPDSETAIYEANAENAYNLIRNGKILEMIDTSFGATAKDVVQSLLLLGQTRISDLVAAYQEKIDQAKNAKQEADDDDPFAEPNGVNGGAHSAKKQPDLVVKSTAQLNSVICRLVEAELIDVVHPNSFETAYDVLKSVEREVMDTHFPTGIKGTKAKIEVEEKIADGLRKVRSESKSLKRKLEQNGTAAKRRKLFMNGATSNGTHEEEADPVLDARQVIRINYEKCLVDLRNRRLVQFVTDTIGETTAYVYGVLLKHLTKALPRCRLDPKIDISEEHLEVGKGYVTTDEILDTLKTSVDLSLGLGKQSQDKFSSRAAERIQEYPPKKKLILEADVDGDASADEEDGDDGDGYESGASMTNTDYKPDQANGTRVQFANSVRGDNKLDRPGQLRQHLLLLAESSQRFVRHCGHNDWTVDFAPLMQVLKEAELDSVIEQQCGRPGLRLVRILRAKGKLDEKAILTIALMRKNEIQQKMLQMMTAGFVHTQEVPRDTKADVKKSFFLWYSDVDKSLNKLLAHSYKSMLHCLQFLEVRRQKEKDVLKLTRRSDVRGREKEVMRKEYYDRYSQFQDHEKRLFAQMMRLDDLIALLKDF